MRNHTKNWTFHSFIAVAMTLSPTAFGAEDCSKVLHRVDGALDGYFKNVWSIQESTRFDSEVVEIRSLMQESLKGECAEAASLHYARRSFDAATKVQRGTAGNSALEVFDLLAKNGKLKILTREIRDELGGEWNDFRQTANKDAYHPLIMAAYDCKTGIVWLDPLLAPFNLGGALAHEFDHMVRDKITYSEHWESHAARAPLAELNVLDEVLANFFGAMTQLRIFYDSIVFNDSRGTFNIEEDADLSLFSRQGVLTELVRVPGARELLRSVGPRGVSWDFSSLLGLYQKPSLSGWRPKMLSIVGASYFPESTLSQEALTASLDAWLAVKTDEETAYPMSLFTDREVTATVDVRSILEKNLNTASAGCKAFAALSYSRSADQRLDKEGTRPDKEGTRPDKEGTRPAKRPGTTPPVLQPKRPLPPKKARACYWPDRRI